MFRTLFTSCSSLFLLLVLWIFEARHHDLVYVCTYMNFTECYNEQLHLTMTVLPFLKTRTQLGIFRQYLAAFTVTIGFLVAGVSYAWSSPVLTKLLLPDSPFTMDDDQVSWAVSLLFLGNFISPIPAGYLADMYGRKKTLLLINVISILSWVLIAIAKTPYMVYVGRVLSGIWVGSVITVVPMYTGEIAEPKVRGGLSNLMSLMTYLGTMYVYTVGPHVSYTELGIFAGLTPVAFHVMFSMMPESPYYYVMKDQHEKAEKSLNWLRGNLNKDELKAEMTLITGSVNSQMQNKGSLKDILTNRGNRKAFIIVEVLGVFLKFAGTGVIMAYASTALPKNAFKYINKDTCVLLISATWVVSTAMSTALVDKLGRRILLTASSAGCSVTMFLVGLWFYFNSETSIDVHQFNWMPFTCFIVHGVFYCLGLGPIGMGIKSEILSANIKAITSAISAIVLASCSIFLTKVYLMLADNIGMYINYWMFSLSSLLAMLFTIFYVIETKNKTLQEIQDELNCISRL